MASSVLDAIGLTPLVELSRITRDLDGRILAKLDYLNPGGSKKDRIALRMIRDAEATGDLSGEAYRFGGSVLAYPGPTRTRWLSVIRAASGPSAGAARERRG